MYWRAYRKRQGKLIRAYLGKSEELTLERLKAVAARLASQDSPQDSAPDDATTLGSHLTADFLAPKSLDLSPHPLPIQLTSFIGREQDVATVRGLLLHQQRRLLTLTGPGGVGKTRLLLAVAEAFLPDFAGMVCFVPLAAISDPAFVLPAIAQALGLRKTAARSPREQVRRALGTQSVLLLLDNLEHVLSAAPALAELPTTCPNLHLLVSSRAPLRLQGEHEVPVSPLPLPDLNHLSARDDLESYAACTLFIQRAQTIAPAFRLTEDNARTIAEICVRLDGLPLAIELAAARIRLLSSQALLTRLTRRLDLLTGGARDLPARQQTLRAAIAWSYQLLTPDAQQLFRTLAVFAGGCTLQALETLSQHAVRAGVGTVLDGVSALLENNLVRQMEQPDGEPRLLLLETVQEYGLECLADMGELEATRFAHAAYYLALAEEAEPQLRGPQQARFMAELEHEQENLRATLSFLLEPTYVQVGVREAESALRLCVALSSYWHDHGHGREGLNFLILALANHDSKGTILRAKALDAATSLAFGYALHMPLEQLALESLNIYQELGDPVGIARSLLRLGAIARSRSQFALAHTLLEEANAHFEELGDHWMQGQCLTELARVAMEQGQFEQTHALLEKSLTLYQQLGHQQRLAWVSYLQAWLLFVSNQDQARAQHLAEESLAHLREQDAILHSAAPLNLLGLIRLEQGDLEAAQTLLEDSLAIEKQFGTEEEDIHLALGRLLALQGNVAAAHDQYQKSLTLLFEFRTSKENVASCLEGLAALEARQGAHRHAARLWGTAEALREAIGAPIYPVYRESVEQAVANVRTTLGEQAFRMAWAQGRSMTPEQSLALQGTAQNPAPVPPSPAAPARKSATFLAGLTAREVEVLRLIAQGWTDAQIAEHLVISPRTVNRHTTSLYSKLGVSSRAAATRSAIEHHLL